MDNLEFIQIVESVAREKGIARDSVIFAMEEAIEVAGKRKYGNEHNIKAEINHKTGEIKLFRVLDIVETVENYFKQISLPDAIERDKNSLLGGVIYDLLPPIDLGRVAAQIANQVLVKKIKEAELEKEFSDFTKRIGEVLNSVVKRIEFGNIIVDLGGRAEGVIRHDQLIKNESFKVNDRVRVFVQDVRREGSGPQIFLSRTDNRFIAKLFELEVPEIYDNIIEIKNVVRDPGSKAKIAVYSSDMNLDAVGSCIGIKGARVRAVSNELSGEKIDVIKWSNDIAQYIINALAPAIISKVVIDEEKNKVEVIVSSDQLSVAIGRKGQNVRLASKLTGWKIDVMTDEQESKRRNEEFINSTELFMEALDVEEVIAQLLVVEGFISVEQVADVNEQILFNIEGFDEELAGELKRRAINYLHNKTEAFLKKLEHLGVEQDLMDVLEGLQLDYLVTLAENGVKTLEDLIILKPIEFKSIIHGSGIVDEQVKKILLKAKAIFNEKEANKSLDN